MIHTIEQTITRLRQIQLDSEHTPVQIVHMILAGGITQSIYNIHTGLHQSALEFLCRETSQVPGYPIPGGVIHQDQKGPFFCKGTPRFPANERPDEFLGALAVAGVHFKSTRIVTNRGTEATLADMAERAMHTYELPALGKAGLEPGWSLMLFSIYPGVQVEWNNERRQICSVEHILRWACNWPYGQGYCLGTHVLEGIAFAVSRYCLEKDLEPTQLTGTWRKGWEYVEQAVRLMRRNQREDGTIQRCWYKENSYPRNYHQFGEMLKDLISRRTASGKAVVFPTGHCLDAISPLSIFLMEDRDWIDSACYILAQTAETHWLEVGRDISPLAHAIHALKLFMD